MKRYSHMREKGKLLVFLLSLVASWCCCDHYRATPAFALEAKGGVATNGEKGSDSEEYHTPLAGEPREMLFMNREVSIPARDRNHMLALTLGLSFLDPKQGDTAAFPFAAFYARHYWADSRTRDVVSVFYNDLEYAKSFGNLELVGRFENYTIPGHFTELVDGEDVEATFLGWGNLIASLGPGLRIPVSPFKEENDFRLQLLGRVGYFYADRKHETGAGVVVPPSTMLYGARLRGRYDSMRRNLLELPHSGIAAGWDLDYMHRNNWRSLGPGSTGSNHRNWLQGSAHLVAAGGIPGLSERDRVIFSLYGGDTIGNGGDRFNAFLINGGPFSGEEEDLARVHYGGIIYDDIRATSYVTTSLAYRRELTFFLYLSTIGSYIWADRATVRGTDQVEFRGKSAAAATVSLDSGFLWDSSLYLAYTWESSLIRNGRSGSGMLLTWNKNF